MLVVVRVMRMMRLMAGLMVTDVIWLVVRHMHLWLRLRKRMECTRDTVSVRAGTTRSAREEGQKISGGMIEAAG